MKSIECYIIQDLLPLYIDHACSEQTAEDIKKHLQSCEKCKKLYEEMSSDICVNLHTPEFNSQTLFYHAKKSVLGIILALAMVISCFAINAGGAWMGGKASLSNLVITALYVIFWSVFSTISRKYEPLIKISLVVSAASFISSTAGLIARGFGIGGFITGIIGLFSAIPFYGLRFFMGWTGLYAVATVLSLMWMIYTWVIQSVQSTNFILSSHRSI